MDGANRQDRHDAFYIAESPSVRQLTLHKYLYFVRELTFPASQKGFVLKKTFKPGEKSPRSGQYEFVGPRGGRTGVERTVTKGEPLPPSRQPGEKFILVDPTKH